jgi:hypothetical protein
LVFELAAEVLAGEITILQVEVPEKPVIVRSDQDPPVTNSILARRVLRTRYARWRAKSWEEALATHFPNSLSREDVAESRPAFDEWLKTKTVVAEVFWSFTLFRDEKGEAIFVQSYLVEPDQTSVRSPFGNPRIDPEAEAPWPIPGAGLYEIQCYRKSSNDSWLIDPYSALNDLGEFLGQHSRKDLLKALIATGKFKIALPK